MAAVSSTMRWDSEVLASLQASGHARVRRQQRGVRSAVEGQVWLHGETHPARDGAVAVQLRRSQLRELLADEPSLRKHATQLERCLQIVAGDGTLITVMWDRLRRRARSLPTRAIGGRAALRELETA